MYYNKILISSILGIALTACGGKTSQEVTINAAAQTGGQVIGTQQFQVDSRSGKPIESPEHGVETGFWYGALSGMDGVNANGVGFLHVFADGSSEQTTNLNITQLDAGYYVVWLAKDAQGTDIQRIGVLENLVGDVRHSLKFESKENLSALTTVLITKEERQDPETHGEVIAKGTLTKVDQ